MLIKILLTLIVIASAAVMLKNRGDSTSAQESRIKDKRQSQMKIGLSAGALLLLSGLWAWDRYQDHYQVLEVRVYGIGESEPQRYQVYQGDIKGRRFTTIHGLQVELGAEDRLVIVSQ